MNYTRLYIIRHGQTIRHDEFRLNGHTDVGLTDVGLAQMDAAAEDLAEVELDAVYSSDLFRARYGGRAIARNHGLELRIEPSFRELFFGDWEGMNFQEVEDRYPGAMEERMTNIVHFRPPGAETIGELWDRVWPPLEKLLEEHRGRHVALVAHSGVNRCLLLRSLGASPELIWRVHQDFGCCNMIDYFEDSFAVLKLINGPNRVVSAT